MSEGVTYDENFIRNYLKKSLEDLQIPFIERRIQSGGHQEDLQDEIIELVQIINENEEHVKTLVQLSYYLLEKGQEKSQDKQSEIDVLEQRIYDFETEVEFHKQSVREYQRLYHDSLEKNNKLSETLGSIENEYSSNQKDYESIKSELHKLRVQSQKMGKLEDVENLKQTFLLNQQEIAELKKNLALTKSESKLLREEISTLTKAHEKQIKNAEKLQYELKNQNNSKKALEGQVKDQKTQLGNLEEMCSIQIQEIDQLKRDVNHLEKELAVSSSLNNKAVIQASTGMTSLSEELSETQNKPVDTSSASQKKKEEQAEQNASKKSQNSKEDQQKNQMQIFLKAHGNLLSELSETTKEAGEMFGGSADEKLRMNSPDRTTTTKIKLDANNLKTTGIVVQQKQQPVRRDPYEEFFMLTSQCVKLNSPYMDDILALDTSTYYKQVLEQYIPFHKWSAWVEDKLHSIRKQLLKNYNSEMMQHQLIQY